MVMLMTCFITVGENLVFVCAATTVCYFYFHLTHSRSPRGPRGASSGLARRPVCQCYSQGFECGVTGANLRRPTITVSPSQLGARRRPQPPPVQMPNIWSSSGPTMELLLFGESWNVTATFFMVDLWVPGWSDNTLVLGLTVYVMSVWHLPLLSHGLWMTLHTEVAVFWICIEK